MQSKHGHVNGKTTRRGMSAQWRSHWAHQHRPRQYKRQTQTTPTNICLEDFDVVTLPDIILPSPTTLLLFFYFFASIFRLHLALLKVSILSFDVFTDLQAQPKRYVHLKNCLCSLFVSRWSNNLRYRCNGTWQSQLTYNVYNLFRFTLFLLTVDAKLDKDLEVTEKPVVSCVCFCLRLSCFFADLVRVLGRLRVETYNTIMSTQMFSYS